MESKKYVKGVKGNEKEYKDLFKTLLKNIL